MPNHHEHYLIDKLIMFENNITNFCINSPFKYEHINNKII